jgi:hypothetical protein
MRKITPVERQEKKMSSKVSNKEIQACADGVYFMAGED